MTRREAIDFDDLVTALVESQTPPKGSWPAIVSGECESGEFLDWLHKLCLKKLDVRIWCYTDRCEIGEAAAPQNIAYLERARLFGCGGDVDIWRDGQGFRWRYIGPSDNAPTGRALSWPRNETNPVFCRERTALLWGNRPKGRARWHDDRVAGAALTYPIDGAPERVQVTYREYTQAGRPFAVWFTGLEEYNND